MVNTFEGSKAETTTMLPVIKAFVAARQLPDDTVVADAGMVSAANKQAIEDAGVSFILGACIPAVPYVVAKWRREHPDEDFSDSRLRAASTLCGRTRRRLPRPQGDNWGEGDCGTHDAGMETTMVSGDEGRKIEKRMVVEYGVTLDGVWLPLAMLRRLAGHGPWDPPFTEATTDQERVLLLHALAERHNRAGLHRGAGLTDFLDAIPYEPTVSFAKLAAEEKDRDKRGEKPAG